MTATDNGETFLQRQRRLRAEAEALEKGVAGWSATQDPEGREPLPADSTRAQRWVQVKVNTQIGELEQRPEGDRNDFLNHVAFSFGRLAPKWLDPTEIAPRLLDAALACGLERQEAVATINSGLASGMKEPRDPPVDPDLFDTMPGTPVVETPPLPPVTPDALEVSEAAVRTAAAEPTPEERLAVWHQRKVAEELALLRARDEAKRIYAEERAAQTFREPPSVLTLREQLQQPREPIKYAIEQILPVGGNALLTAQYKTGKTTFVANLLRAYADGEAFLGKFAVHPHPGRIAIFNYELGQAQFDTWLEEAGIANPDRVSVLHLRGYRLPLTTARVEDWIVGWLRDHDVAVWIADPFARAAVGTDENSNTDVGIWLDTFDVIKERAGVSEGVLPVHTGRGEQEQGAERARGATRLDDWADVRWILTKDKDQVRFFRATGRDVDLAEEKLTYDETRRAYQFGGWDRHGEERRRLEDQVVAYVVLHPGESQTAIEKGVEGKATAIRSALQGAVRGHRIRVEEGPKNGLYYFPQVLG